jgi:hypothetical protein
VKVEITPPSAVEAEDISESAESGLLLKPLFYGNGREPAASAVVKVYSEAGNLVYLGILKVSGIGKPSLQERTKPVVPKLDRTPKKR